MQKWNNHVNKNRQWSNYNTSAAAFGGLSFTAPVAPVRGRTAYRRPETRYLKLGSVHSVKTILKQSNDFTDAFEEYAHENSLDYDFVLGLAAESDHNAPSQGIIRDIIFHFCSIDGL